MAYYIGVVFSGLSGFKLPNLFLWTLVILALFNSLNNTFQGWSSYHYYIGAKYFTELGYFDLYECTAVAPIARRNLHDYSFRFDVPRCNADFQDLNRVAEFRHDIFRSGFYNQALADKGYNGTPPLIAVNKFLINSHLINLNNFKMLDVIALAVALVVLIWSVGWRKSAYIALFILTYYGTIDRLWGHFSQWLWLSSALVGVALLHKNKSWGAFWVGVSSALAIFPVFLMLAYIKDKRAVGWSVIGLVFMLWVGLFSGRGVAGYTEFLHNMTIHSNYIRTELCCNIGLAHTVASSQNPDSDYLTCFNDSALCREDYSNDFSVIYWLTLFPLVATSPLGAMFALITLSRYYMLILAVIPVWYSERWAGRLQLLNTLSLIWFIRNPEQFFIYGDWLWFIFFLLLGVSNVIQVNTALMEFCKQGLYTALTVWRVRYRIR